MSDASLTEWGGGTVTPPPKVNRKFIVQSPHTGKIAGFVGWERNRGHRAYTALRRRAHVYRNDNGYAISDSILDILEERGVARIYIHLGVESDQADVYEYLLRQYRPDGRPVPEKDLHDPADPQTYVGAEEYVHKWPEHSGELFVRPFRKACEHIGWRGYDPELREDDDG